MTWLSSSVSVSPAATPQIPPATNGMSLKVIYVCVGSGANTFGNLVYICTEPNVH